MARMLSYMHFLFYTHDLSKLKFRLRLSNQDNFHLKTLSDDIFKENSDSTFIKSKEKMILNFFTARSTKQYISEPSAVRKVPTNDL